MQKRMDHHRLLSEWAEQYGPIYRTRFLMFHVCETTSETLCALSCNKLVLYMILKTVLLKDPAGG